MFEAGSGNVGAWRLLITGDWQAFPMRFLMASLAIAIGIALAFAVHVINRSAADSFNAAVRSVSGEADLQVRAVSSLGFDEAIYPRLMGISEVADASPVVTLGAVIGDREAPVTLLGLDMLRAVGVSPSLLGRRREAGVEGSASRPSGADAALDIDALYLSDKARKQAELELGEQVQVRVGARSHVFTLVGDLPGAPDGQMIGMIDISAAQWRFERLGKLDRVDLKLAKNASLEAARTAISRILPVSARLSDELTEIRRGDNLSRAYRINLDMLALVALLTGGFLVYSAQSLSVTRRLQQFALIRTLGIQRGALTAQLLGEGAVLGIIGSVVGLGLGYVMAAAVLEYAGGDLGGGYFDSTAPSLSFSPAAALLFLCFGLATGIVGSYAPARAAARISPAEALKTADDPIDPRIFPRWRAALFLILAGTALAFLPAVNRLPLFGYLAVALVLAGGIAAMPWLARTLLSPLARIDARMPSFELALLRLIGAPSQAATALGGIVASTGLMMAMAIMVTSFRGSVDDWLESFLSADLYAAAATNEPLFDAATQERIASVPGVASVAFSKSVPVTIDPELPALMVVVRPVGGPGYALPLITKTDRGGVGVSLWLSEPAARLYGVKAGDRFDLPIAPAGQAVRGYVAGIWRDYARQQGAVVIDNTDYVALTGDTVRSEAAIELEPQAIISEVRAAIAERLPPSVARRVEFAEPATLRSQALTLFDRSFAITYALEAVAILIGLAGVATTISAQTMSRIREFGMLRHIGTTRRQIIGMLAGEGALLGVIGIAAGCAVGLALSQILIHVINPQSFNWTMTTQVPWKLLLGVAAALVGTSAATAVLAGRRAVSRDAVRAVSEDW